MGMGGARGGDIDSKQRGIHKNVRCMLLLFVR
jgi:hypothetical protein